MTCRVGTSIRTVVCSLSTAGARLTSRSSLIESSGPKSPHGYNAMGRAPTSVPNRSMRWAGGESRGSHPGRVATTIRPSGPTGPMIAQSSRAGASSHTARRSIASRPLAVRSSTVSRPVSRSNVCTDGSSPSMKEIAIGSSAGKKTRVRLGAHPMPRSRSGTRRDVGQLHRSGWTHIPRGDLIDAHHHRS